MARWKCGSDSTFWRAEADGLLIPQRSANGRPRYTWQDVWAFEGGQPPAGMTSAYRANLLTPDEVASLASYAPDTIVARARAGRVPCRRIGQAYRFVPAEIARWLENWS